jgi:hypothetical protein
MAPLPRDLRVDAFFSDEWLVLPLSNPRGVHFNRFSTPTFQPATTTLMMQNPLDPIVGAGLIQPESQIPGGNQGAFNEYCIFVPPALLALAQFGPLPFPVKVSVLFCVGTEYNRHGLRSFFATLTDRVLITVPGIEPDASTGNRAWGIGITTDMINQLFGAAGTPSLANSVVDIIAGYSTGYRGVNGTVNNALLPLSPIRRVIFYDALYWGDEPPLQPGTSAPAAPPDVSPPPPSSPRNTWRMLNALRAANSGVDLVTYEVTEPGGTPRDAGKLRVDVPASRIINLKAQQNALTALILARVLGNGVQDGYFSMSSVPTTIASLIASLPARGTLASSPFTAASATSGTLADWATAHAAEVASAVAQSAAGIALIVSASSVLMGWGLRGGQLGEMLHDGFIQEFGWEFLAG